ncbi:hypothetical protein G4Y79_00785 [Phototrophicus methaneseepsis]|uniref:DUF2268 domain-containing protein n=1 Tax=Phototrophicus methaneseepsis TaxID=2710758 RepID=A0A7S8E9N5_9CHLR|nr:DUF2268 domain-containing putative Zn-dependent protease [Phototrophicus methaneseepsis]QPC82941.1 hypothetical protein G4Y79_00785 [Phototrophicus methaneseepsis]
MSTQPIATQFVATNRIYHDVIHAPDAETRQQRYIQGLVQPWQQMMSMMSQGDDDPLAGARTWNWLLPDQLTTEPDVLTTLEAADVWRIAAEAMQRAVQCFAPYADRIPFDHIEGWLTLGDAERSDPVLRGYTGATDWFQPRFVVQYDTPTEANLRALPGTVVHEMHHLIRLRIFPFTPNITVGEYIVLEGLAESFAGALFGDAVLGHYVTDFDNSQLATAKALIQDGLDVSGFGVVRAYIFGDHWRQMTGAEPIGMPTYGGYAIGYRIVQAYLQQTGRTIAEATFLPADEIISESGYFG